MSSSSSDAGWGGADLAQPARPTLRTIEDAINSISADCRRDKFFADMAKPADVAIQKFREGDRDTGLMLLHHLNEQLASAAEGGHLFLSEARMCKIILDLMESDAALTMDSPLSHVAAAAHAAQEKVAVAAGQQQQQQQRMDAVRNALTPYKLVQTVDAAEMTVSIQVPAETKTKDVRVKVTKDSLSVSVVAHALQPTVLDGRFLHDVDASACGWHLEGAGEQRALVLDLEKAAAGLDWGQVLLAVGRS